MKISGTPALVQLSKETLERLVTPVEERLATEVPLLRTTARPKRFGVTDLWKMRSSNRYKGISIR